MAPVYLPDLGHIYGMLSGKRRRCGLTRQVLAVCDSSTVYEVERRYQKVFAGTGLAAEARLLVVEDDEATVGEELRSYLAGRNDLPRSFGNFATLARGGMEEPLFPASVENRLSQLAEMLNQGVPHPVVLLSGSRGNGHTLAAQILVWQRTKGLIEVDLERVPGTLSPLELAREARLLDLALLLKIPGELDRAWWGRQLDELVNAGVQVILSTDSSVPLLRPDEATTFPVAIPRPGTSMRVRLWDRYLPHQMRVDGLSSEHLAFRFRGTARSIAELSRAALDETMLSDSAGLISMADLNRVSHTALAGSLSGLGGAGSPV